MECQLIGGSVGAITLPYDIQMGLHGDCLLQRMGTGCNRLERGKVASWFLQLTQHDSQHSSHSTSTSSSARAWEVYDIYKSSRSIVFYRKKTPYFHTTSSSMSQPAISDTTNRPNPPKAGPVKSLSVPPSVTPLLIPSHAPAQGPIKILMALRVMK